jgi:hypothetical protein
MSMKLRIEPWTMEISPPQSETLSIGIVTEKYNFNPFRPISRFSCSLISSYELNEKMNRRDRRDYYMIAFQKMKKRERFHVTVSHVRISFVDAFDLSLELFSLSKSRKASSSSARVAALGEREKSRTS